MPRGVQIPEIRQQLFAALERVIVQDGSGKISGRGITVEAGVATGLLYAHFSDLDSFLAAYAVDRSFAICAGVGPLADQVGQGTVVNNIATALLATPLATLRALTRLLAARPILNCQVQETLGENTAGLNAIQPAVAGYLRKEQHAGRSAGSHDHDAMALAIVGVLHHQVIGVAAEQDVGAVLIRLLAELTGAPTPPARVRTS